MFKLPAVKIRNTAVIGLVALALALLSPMALAGQHGRYGGHHGSYGHGSYSQRSHAYRSRGYRTRGYRSYRGYRGYRSAYRPVRYNRYRHHGHWRAGEVLGAVVAGAIMTSVIADAFEPRRTVVERRVYRSDYPDYSRATRYIGPAEGYYDSRR